MLEHYHIDQTVDKNWLNIASQAVHPDSYAYIMNKPFFGVGYVTKILSLSLHASYALED